ncbi:hypothetical protein HDU97_005880 [Phlyctochytrium planicorne]|nr:hypothetical protein HDU97_005880 [Phlyctochytrium planicorne]
MSQKLEARLTKIVQQAARSNTKVITKFAPHDFVRRDLCLVDYLATVSGFVVVFLAPTEFLRKGTLYQDHNHEVEFATKVYMESVDRWMLFVPAIVTLCVSMICEFALLFWETYQGYRMYKVTYPITFTGLLKVVVTMQCILFWYLSGARGLFAYGLLAE